MTLQATVPAVCGPSLFSFYSDVLTSSHLKGLPLGSEHTIDTWLAVWLNETETRGEKCHDGPPS
jgi:hypothetical protein